jgi:hypothetical protein
MGYQLALDTPGGPPHPSFAYPTLEAVLEAAESAIANGYIEIQGGITICTGPGTAYKVLSDEHIAAQMPQGDFAHYLIVQVGGGQLPAMGFESEEDARQALQKARDDGGGYSGVLRHVARDGHEYTYVCLSGGAVIMSMTQEALQERRQRALEEQARKRQEGGVAGDLVQVPKIFIPGRN